MIFIIADDYDNSLPAQKERNRSTGSIDTYASTEGIRVV